MQITCEMMLPRVLIKPWGSVFQGASHLGPVEQNSSGCGDGWVPGTPVGYECESFGGWQLEHSKAPTSDTLEHPKFKYMNGWLYPSVSKISSLIFEVSRAVLFSVELVENILHKTRESNRKHILLEIISVRSLHQFFFNLLIGELPLLHYWFPTSASWKFFPACKQWYYLHFLTQLKYIVSHSSVWKDRERIKE